VTLPALAHSERALVTALFGDGADSARVRIGKLIKAVGAVPQVEMPVRNHWAPHLYVREILVPKGTVAVGKIHRHPHLAVMLRGDMTFLTKRGVDRFAGAQVLPLAPAYTQRAVLAHEDTVLLNLHPCAKRDIGEADLADLEAAVIAPEGEGDPLEGDDLIREIAKFAED
jgi:hypothetical protein